GGGAARPPPAGPPRGCGRRPDRRPGAAGAPPMLGRRRIWPLVVLPAAILAAASFALVVASGRVQEARDQAAACQTQLEAQRAALQLLELPSTKVVPLAAQAGSAGAVAILNLERQKAALVAHGLVPPHGQDYPP